ncbi:hypothetical protein KDA_75000 [Dictyobacter alpinus]|uniref:Uncharacterized protein n=1 Tax=Dictyobacter alpinus TaxID=2014873 RepID=A0A402BL14_9CHLR|nr:hypothetical protein [Dictyobacter alpinus]GCE32016.1 hypothetical protein KDA_75000 [Dictyobacter alpinus]
MGVFQTCLLLYSALAGSFFAAFSPSRRWSARKASMSPEAIKEYEQEKNELGLSHGCAVSLSGAWEIVHLYLVEPFYVIWAVLVHVQPLGLAYGALAIIVVRMVLLCAAFAIPFPKTSASPSSSTMYWLGVVVWSLPTLYLWFLFGVVIGLVH